MSDNATLHACGPCPPGTRPLAEHTHTGAPHSRESGERAEREGEAARHGARRAACQPGRARGRATAGTARGALYFVTRPPAPNHNRVSGLSAARVLSRVSRVRRVYNCNYSLYDYVSECDYGVGAPLAVAVYSSCPLLFTPNVESIAQWAFFSSFFYRALRALPCAVQNASSVSACGRC